MSENTKHPEIYIRALEGTNRLTKKAIQAAIRDLNLPDNSAILDTPCGIGNHSRWLTEENPTTSVTGADFSREHIQYAIENILKGKASDVLRFETDDMNKLSYEDDTFDAVWCCDGLWPGPADIGCIAEQPDDILKDFSRITRNGGTIAILFWTGCKLLPGYPCLESALNATISSNRPFKLDTSPDLHIMRTSCWLETLGATDIQCRTYAADIQGPLEEWQKQALYELVLMLWGDAESEVSAEVWDKLNSIIDLDSEECVFNLPHYSGYIIYSMFTGINMK